VPSKVAYDDVVRGDCLFGNNWNKCEISEDDSSPLYNGSEDMANNQRFCRGGKKQIFSDESIVGYERFRIKRENRGHEEAHVFE
jgi:hypothetical protein